MFFIIYSLSSFTSGMDFNMSSIEQVRGDLRLGIIQRLNIKTIDYQIIEYRYVTPSFVYLS